MSENSKKEYIKGLKDVPDTTKTILDKITTEVNGVTPEMVLRWRVMSEQDAEAYFDDNSSYLFA